MYHVLTYMQCQKKLANTNEGRSAEGLPGVTAPPPPHPLSEWGGGGGVSAPDAPTWTPLIHIEIIFC